MPRGWHCNIYLCSGLNYLRNYSLLPCLLPPTKMMRPTLTYGRISAVQIILEEKNKTWLANAVKEMFLSKDYKQNKVYWCVRVVLWLWMRGRWWWVCQEFHPCFLPRCFPIVLLWCQYCHLEILKKSNIPGSEIPTLLLSLYIGWFTLVMPIQEFSILECYTE